MTWKCLIVDLSNPNRVDTWQNDVQGQDFGCEIVYVTTVAEAMAVFPSGTVAVLAVFTTQASEEIQSLLKGFRNHVGCVPEFQVVICDDPDPRFMAAVFENGIEQFVSTQDWAPQVAHVAKKAMELIADPATPESKTLALMNAIRLSDQKSIQVTADALREIADHDYRAAYAHGKAAEASGDYNSAIDSFKNASSMNKLFRPSSASLGESLLISGRLDEALEVFQNLERTNPFDVDRKAHLAATYIEKGDLESAQKYLDAAEALSAKNSSVLEVKAQVLLTSGQMDEAFKLLDELSEVGAFFASKLNEQGIRLSKAGKGKSALALYQKAHKIVRAELKYKISLNAALACRRAKAWDTALKYLARCQKEYGAPFPKLERLREAIKKEKEADVAPDVTDPHQDLSKKAG